MKAKSKMGPIGAHTSGAGGLYNALTGGVDIGATTIQLFTANQRRWLSKAISDSDVEKWHDILQKTGLQTIMSHDSYLINLGSHKPDILEKSKDAFLQELQRCHKLDITFLNFHPGAATDAPVEQCLDTICDSLLAMEKEVAAGDTFLLLEATAGQGSTVGASFDQLAYIIGRVQKRVPIGVCIDTCHIFAAGYDIRTAEAWDATLQTFDKTVGLKNLHALHLNDSLKPLGSRVDRHAPLGKGEIGLDSFRFIMNDERLRPLPKYLETPDGPPLWVKEIAMLKEFAL